MESLELEIAEWRSFVGQAPAVDGRDVEELEAHLRDQIADLSAAGLAADEAFLIAVKRMGSLDDLSREFAREHTGRLWRQLVVSGGDDEHAVARRWPEALLFAGAAAVTLLIALLVARFPDEEPAWLYRNDGGTFTDVSTASGIGALRSNGMGVLIADGNDDGWPDVFVANDSLPNFLFRNAGTLRFRNEALTAGVAVAADGQPRAGMGIDAGDYDRDGRLDLVITNLDFQMHSLHRGLDGGMFAWSTIESGIGYATLPFVGFGVAFLDVDDDGRLELAIANGHILDNAPEFRSGATYRQRNLLFRNTTGRRFAEVGRSAGPGFALEKVSRGLAAGDIDNDGDLDLLVTNNGETADLLRNDLARRGTALLVRLIGTGMNRDAIGARVRVTTGSITQRRDVVAGSSYLSQHDLRLHFGLGAATEADVLEVRWPSGKTETLRGVPAGQIITLQEGKGIVSRTRFAQ